ncbi:MAG: hypothetical protein M3439_11130, partial [Chloroflexota bacterium]|nr:hypothetical protein [Chloroflexota bacterium]
MTLFGGLADQKIPTHGIREVDWGKEFEPCTADRLLNVEVAMHATGVRREQHVKVSYRLADRLCAGRSAGRSSDTDDDMTTRRQRVTNGLEQLAAGIDVAATEDAEDQRDVVSLSNAVAPEVASQRRDSVGDGRRRDDLARGFDHWRQVEH